LTYIRRLEMRGFKSSGPRPVVVTFEKGFTVITGPNGSGKSNIADAILFAIGENSPKQLRAQNGRLTGVIYDPKKEDAPAPDKPRDCRVTLQLDNADRSIPVDSDLVTVTRELRDDGENVYYLNGKKVTRGGLMEVIDLAGLSPGGLNVVPQGSATKVADMTPEEKRRLIEDVVGISKFDEKKSEAQRQLSQADQRLEVAMARIGEMKGTLSAFDAQRNDMIRFNLLEGQIRWLSAVKTAKKIGEYRVRLDSLRSMAREAEARVQELTTRLDETEQKTSRVEEERTRFIVDVIQGGGSSHVDLQFQLAQVENDLNTLETGLKDSEENLRSLEDETVPQLKEVVATKEKEVSASSSLVKQLTSELSKLDAKHLDHAERLKQYVSAADELRGTIDKTNRQSARVQVKLADLAQKQNQAELAINASGAALGAERKRLDELKRRVDGYATLLGNLDTKTKQLSDLYEGSTKELNSLDASFNSADKKKTKLQASIDSARKVLEKATAEVSKEMAFRQVSQSLAGERTGQFKLQEFCDSGGVPGYVGRLGQFVKFPQQYSKPVNAVMGRWMSAFVVEDLHSMTQLIKAAKTFNARAFAIIPLSEVAGCSEVEVERSAGVVGPLAKLVKHEERFEGLVNFIAGDTVLVDTEAIGYILASEGVKAVTLEGEVFEPGGRAFTFGYQEVLMNLMQGLENIEGISDIEDAVGALRGAIERRKAQLEAAESDSRSLLKERAKRIASVAGLKAESNTFGGITSRYRSIFKAMNSEFEKQAKLVAKLEGKVNAATERRDSISRGVGSLQELLRNTRELGLEEMLAELEGAKTTLSSEVDGIRNRIAETNLSLLRERANLENVLSRTLEENKIDLENAQADLASFKDYVRDAPKRIKELSEQKAELSSQIDKIKESSRKSQPVLDEFESRLRRLKEERESTSRSRTAAEKELLTVNGQVEGISGKVEDGLGSLRILGYSEEPEVFDGADSLLAELESEYQQVVYSVNRGADRQYKEMFVNYKSLSVRHNELEKERNSIIAFIESVDAEKRKVFVAAYERIGEEFKGIFGRLTGGEAWLELEKPDDIFSGGVLLMARFGSKPAWESLSLSGGEKAVSGVSLILAMQGVQPHPFYLFDEIDAALDAVNSGNLAQFIKSRSETAQMISITLRDVFVAESDTTYGVYSAGGVSRMVHYKPAELPINRG